jgi:hypothetical protein
MQIFISPGLRVMCRPLRQAVVPIRFVPGNLVTPFQLTPVHLYRLMSREADAKAYGATFVPAEFSFGFQYKLPKRSQYASSV